MDRRAASLLRLMTIFPRLQTGSGEDASFVYPYGTHAGLTIEYDSYDAGSNIEGRLGFNDSLDQAWLGLFKEREVVVDASASNVTRWLEPVDGIEYEARLDNGVDDITNIYNRNGTYPLTRIWDGDDFWEPACSRLASEVRWLQEASPYPTSTKGTTVKHYGASFPDSSNHNQSTTTYVHATVLSAGNDLVAIFNKSCVSWLGALAADTGLVRPSLLHPNGTDLVVNGSEVHDSAGDTIRLPPLLLKGTAGGVKAVRGADGSVFVLWLLPTDV